MAEAKFYTYIHKKADTGEVFYVGKGKGHRCNDKNNRNKHWQNFYDKHGLVVEIVATFSDEQAAFLHEKELISEYRDSGIALANYTDGGEGQSGISPNKEAREKLSKALKGKSWTVCQREAFNNSVKRKEHYINDDQRKKMDDARRIGYKNKTIQAWNSGKRLSETHRLNIGTAHKGRPFCGVSAEMNEEMRNKISKALTGRKYSPLSEGHKKKISNALAGKAKQPFSDETKLKMSEARKAYWAAKKSESAAS